MSEGNRRYEILRAIGRGGMGSIYLARLESGRGFTKEVALKIATPKESNHEALGRLRDEARVLGLLRHRAIVGVDGLVKLDGKWTVVMEYVAGLNLSAMVQGVGAIPMGVALEIVAEVAAALDAAFHTCDPNGKQLCLQHRDIKPSNILVTPHGEVKVLDFGIARAEFEARESITKDHFYGSSGYMAPERFDLIGHERSDVYSLGVVLFTLLTGKRFGKASTHPERHRDLVMLRLGMLSDYAPVARLVGRMLTYDPDERPSAREVHRMCSQLRPGHAETLHDWAESRIPPLLAEHRESLELGAYQAGQVLTEHTMITPAGVQRLVPDMTLEQDAPQDRASHRNLGFALFGGALLALLLAGLFFYLGGPTEIPVQPAPATPSGPVEPEAAPALVAPEAAPIPVAPTAQPDPVAAAPPTAQPNPVAPAPPTAQPDPPAAPVAPETAPVPVGDVAAPAPTTPARAPAPVAPLAAPAPVAPPTPVAAPPAPHRAHVKLTGDAKQVTLVDGSSRYPLPQRVPPGHYQIRATFGGDEPLSVGTVDVPAEGTVEIGCNALFVGCEVH